MEKIMIILLNYNNYKDTKECINSIKQNTSENNFKYAIENKSEYILLLNNDTIITKNSIDKMYLELKKHNEIGIISARIMYWNNKDLINCCGGEIDYFKGTAVIYNKGKEYKDDKNDS